MESGGISFPPHLLSIPSFARGRSHFVGRKSGQFPTRSAKGGPPGAAARLSSSCCIAVLRRLFVSMHSSVSIRHPRNRP